MLKRLRKWFALWCLKHYLKYREIKIAEGSLENLDVSFTINGAPVARPTNYIEVTPATAAKPETDIERLMYMGSLMRGLVTMEDLKIVHKKCDNDFHKTYNVLQLMARTYQTDDDVLKDYPEYMRQMGHKLEKW